MNSDEQLGHTHFPDTPTTSIFGNHAGSHIHLRTTSIFEDGRPRPPREEGRVSERLPQLLDAKALIDELGITRAAAEKIMRQIPTVQIPGLRKNYCRRADAQQLLESCTFTKDQVPA
jgi:hypothetical protein